MDFQLVKSCLQRSNYNVLKPQIPYEVLGQGTVGMLRWIGAFYTSNPEAGSITTEQLKAYITMRMHKQLDTDGVKVLMKLCDQVAAAPEEYTPTLLNSLLELDFAGKVGALYTRYESGGEVAFLDEVTALAKEYQAVRGVPEIPEHDILEILKEMENQEGVVLGRLALLREYLTPVQGGASIALAARPDKGKCQSPDTPILLATGEVIRADQVVVGDVLAGATTNNVVTSITRGTDAMYRVTYPWGESYVVNEAHILSLKRSKVEGKHQYGDILNVSVKEYLTWGEGRKGRYKGWKTGVEFPTKAQTIPPYILGVWLGDGTATKPQITNADPEVIQEVEQTYGEPTRVWDGVQRDYYKTPLLKQLGDLNLRGNKHIPSNYLTGDRQQRLDLLAGLLDTDGYNTGSGYEITVKDNTLAEQVVYLARSLGIHAVSKPSFKRATNSNHKGDWYNRILLGSEAHVVPLRLTRKRLAQPTNPKRQGLQFGIKVEPIGQGEYVGWTLTGDRLYVLGDFTVTHNTSFLCSLITGSAESAMGYYGANRPILHLVNEGNERRVIPRLYQAAMGITSEEMYAKAHAGTLVADYANAIQAEPDYIKVIPIHGRDIAYIEQLVEEYNPSIVVTDMLEHVGYNAASKTEKITGLWEKIRDIAIIHDFISIATVQIGESGGNTLFPTYDTINYSKTGIQAATDIILMMGALDSVEYQEIRGLSTPKNKFSVQGKPSYVESEVVFDKDRCIFDDGTDLSAMRTVPTSRKQITTEEILNAKQD